MESVSNTSTGAVHGTLIQAVNVTVHEHGGVPAFVPPVPLMLPFAPDGFVDREELRARLDELAAERGARRAPTLVYVGGGPGVGKSAVSLYWARERVGEFPGGVLYADMDPGGGLGPADPAAVLEGFLAALGTLRGEMPGTLGGLAARFRSRTADRPCLVVLDGVVAAGQVLPHLLPGHPAGMVLVTSRKLLRRLGTPEVAPVARLTVAELDEGACRELFAAAVGGDVPDEAALRAVVSAAGGLPYVLHLAAAQAADPYLDGLAGLARRLAERRSILEAFDVPDLPEDGEAARRFIDVSYDALDEEARAGLRRLGAHPTAEFADGLVDLLAGPGVRARLYDAGLLERSAPGRSRMNAVLHAYARERGAAERAPATRVFTDWYLRRAAAAEVLVSGRWRYGPLFAEPGQPGGVFADQGDALDALDADRTNLVALAELCRDRPETVCQLAEALHGFFFRRGHQSLWLRVNRIALRAADGLGGLPLARMHFELAFALLDRGADGDLEEAREQYDKARESARRIGHARTESSALEGLGQIAERQGDPAGALAFYAEALAALGGLAHPRGRALLEYHQGRAASAAGLHERAREQLLSAIRGFGELTPPDPHNMAKARVRYAAARLAAGAPAEAPEPLGEALAYLARGASAGGLDHADALLVRGDAHRESGDPRAARADWRAALELYGALGSVRAEEARIRLARLADPSGEQGEG
ncbi:tetratricopeptide repeat protein [Streptomyces sp. NPDC002138]|uniref:tetratricopeptide repeat protein n=1 Tax=Streptomyces sp. NPDC002138 TaxID=3154410 RepID=UPI0033333BA5